MKTIISILFSVIILQSCSPVYAASSKPSISISTATAIPLQTTSGINVPDIWWYGVASKGHYHNTAIDPYLSIFKALGAQRMVAPVAGSLSHYAMFDSTGKGDGYNFKVEYFINTTDQFTTYDGGVSQIKWHHDFFDDMVNLKNAAGMECDFVYNIQFGSYNILKASIRKFQPKRIILGAELITQWNFNDYMNALTTVTRSLRADYPDMIICGYIPNMYRENPLAKAWIDGMQASQVDELCQYHQIGDLVSYCSNMNTNLSGIINYFSVTAPQFLNDFKAEYPDKKMSITQAQPEDKRGNIEYVNNTPLSAYAIAEDVVFVINHTQDIASWDFESADRLIGSDDSPRNDYYAVQQVMKVFGNGKSVATISFTNMPGVTGCVTFSGNYYTMIIDNSSDNSYSVNSTTLNGGKQKVDFTRSVIWCNAWTDLPIRETATEKTKFTVKPRCTSLISFYGPIPAS